ncbi:heterokaryon incompatibility protein-domain-containing protein [Xylaria palmicola]|nr:heterokaryon incompatibility protein-domain-containing protein [Xylaria palmicola]
MRLLHVKTLKLTDFSAVKPPKYAILSHCWRHGHNEILFEDVEFSEPVTWQDKKKEAANKVLKACAVTDETGYEYVWIDTCCIDKRSSAELSEAINSMYFWYNEAAVCIAFLDDTDGRDDLGSSRWFTRGWTLQELIAPDNVWFYNRHWSFIGDRFSMFKALASITGIDEGVLRHGHNPWLATWDMHDRTGNLYSCPCGVDWPELRWILDKFSVATIMSWAAQRQTSREEDVAYCLMGLFDINMPLLYGERNKAFRRLQEEIVRRTNDQSILAWVDRKPSLSCHALARSPSCFSNFGQHIEKPRFLRHELHSPVHKLKTSTPIRMTKEGVEVELLVCKLENSREEIKHLGILDCTKKDSAMARLALPLLSQSQSNDVFVAARAYLLMLYPLDSWPSADGSDSNEVCKVGERVLGLEGSITWAERDTEIQISVRGVSRVLLLEDSTMWDGDPLLEVVRVGRVTDCDAGAGEYTVEGAPLSEADQEADQRVKFFPIRWDRGCGLLLFTKQQGRCEFFIAWSTTQPRTRKWAIWCRVLPAGPMLKRLFVSAKEGGFVLATDLLSDEECGHVSPGHRAVVDLGGGCSREVRAEVKEQRFLGQPFVELTVDVFLPPPEESERMMIE